MISHTRPHGSKMLWFICTSAQKIASFYVLLNLVTFKPCVEQTQIEFTQTRTNTIKLIVVNAFCLRLHLIFFSLMWKSERRQHFLWFQLWFASFTSARGWKVSFLFSNGHFTTQWNCSIVFNQNSSKWTIHCSLWWMQLNNRGHKWMQPKPILMAIWRFSVDERRVEMLFVFCIFLYINL